MNQPTASCAAVIALKDLDQAKSRFGDSPAALRERLASMMLVDTTRAVLGAVDQIVVVTGTPGVGALLDAHDCPVEVLPDPGQGLNAAFSAGAEMLADRGIGQIIAIMADLPAVTPAALVKLVAATREPGRRFVPDAAGTGTTALVATGQPLDPHFGPDSAQAHRASGAEELVAEEGLRLDVDRPDDLAAAARLGLGAATAPLWAGAAPAEIRPVTVLSPTAVVDAAGRRLELPDGVLDPTLREIRPGQRLHAALVGRQITQAWL